MATLVGIVVRYRAIHEYSPDGDDEDARGYVALQPGDMLEAHDPAASSDFVGTLQEPNCWLNGVNTRTGQQGLFPSTYVTFVEVVQPSPTPTRPAAPPPKVSFRGKPKSREFCMKLFLRACLLVFMLLVWVALQVRSGRDMSW